MFRTSGFSNRRKFLHKLIEVKKYATEFIGWHTYESNGQTIYVVEYIN